jgi:hypothetical protein
MDREMLFGHFSLTCWVWRNNSSKSRHRHRSTNRYCFNELLVLFDLLFGASLHPFHNLCWGVKITKQCNDGTVQEWVILAPQTMNNLLARSGMIIDRFILLCGDIQCNNQLLLTASNWCKFCPTCCSKWGSSTAAKATPNTQQEPNHITRSGNECIATRICIWLQCTSSPNNSIKKLPFSMN